MISQLRLSEDVGPEIQDAFLALELEASAPYNHFVYGEPGLIAQAQRALWQARSGEFVAPHGRAALLEDRVVGIVSGLMAGALTPARLTASLTLTRSGLLRDPAVKRRVRGASQTLMAPDDTDYYLSRIAVITAQRSHLHNGRTLAATLIAQLEYEARAAGAHRIVADVSAELPRLLAFYARLGFGQLEQADITDPDSGRRLSYAHLAKTLD